MPKISADDKPVTRTVAHLQYSQIPNMRSELQVGSCAARLEIVCDQGTNGNGCRHGRDAIAKVWELGL